VYTGIKITISILCICQIYIRQSMSHQRHVQVRMDAAPVAVHCRQRSLWHMAVAHMKTLHVSDVQKDEPAIAMRVHRCQVLIAAQCQRRKNCTPF
jgi:hypothetical protein